MNDEKFDDDEEEVKEDEEGEEEEATVWKGNPCLSSSERHVWLPKGLNPHCFFFSGISLC